MLLTDKYKHFQIFLDYLQRATPCQWKELMKRVSENGFSKVMREKVFSRLMDTLSDDEQSNMMEWYQNHEHLPTQMNTLSHEIQFRIMTAVAYDLGNYTLNVSNNDCTVMQTCINTCDILFSDARILS